MFWWQICHLAKNLSKKSISIRVLFIFYVSFLTSDNPTESFMDRILTGPKIFPFQCLRSSPITFASTTYSPLA